MRCYIGNNNLKTLLKALVPPESPRAFFLCTAVQPGMKRNPRIEPLILVDTGSLNSLSVLHQERPLE